MSYTYLIPDWFFGFSVGMEALFSIVALSIAITSFYMYWLSKEKSLRRLGTGFLCIGLSYISWAAINLIIVSHIADGLRSFELEKLAYLDALGFTLYMLLFIAGLVTFAYATLKLERGEIYYLLLGTSLLVVVSSSAKFITFRLLAVFLLTFVAYHYYCAWRENKNKRILYVFLATALLLLSSITFIFAPHYYQAYVIGHLLEFGAYLCMLFTLVKSLKR